MADASTLPMAESRVLIAGFRRVNDPGDAGTFTVNNKGEAHCLLTSAASAETRVLQDAGGFGVGSKLRVFFLVDGGGAITITGSDQTIVLKNAGDIVEFTVSATAAGEATKVWRVTSDSRVGANGTAQLPLNEFRIHDDFDTFLPETAAVDDLGFIEGTFGTSAPSLQAITATGLTDSSYGRIQWPVPSDYAAGKVITITAVVTEADAAAVSSVLDAQVYRVAAPTVDVQATAATTIVGGATVVFTLTSTNIVAGDILDIRLQVTNDDTAGDGTDHSITSVTINY